MDGELSCDWAKFQKNPFESIHIRQGKDVVIAITVCDAIKNPCNPKNGGKIESSWKQEVIYDPVKKSNDPPQDANKAHSLIKGKKKSAVTDIIRDHSKRIYNT